MEKARNQANELLKIFPFFSLQNYQYRSWSSTDEETDKAITQFHKELLKKCGIPESGGDFVFRERRMQQ
jgi:hypothetical protein